jgi:hypothetical protein
MRRIGYFLRKKRRNLLGQNNGFGSVNRHSTIDVVNQNSVEEGPGY